MSPSQTAEMGEVEFWVGDPTHSVIQRFSTIAAPVGGGGLTALAAIASRPTSKGKSHLMFDTGLSQGIPVAVPE